MPLIYDKDEKAAIGKAYRIALGESTKEGYAVVASVPEGWLTLGQGLIRREGWLVSLRLRWQ